VGAARLLLCLKAIPLEKLYELERIYISILHDCSDSKCTIWNRPVV
jgi:hypothetical protein